MGVRDDNLPDLTGIPLPHGTEVTTTASLTSASGAPVPAGTVGRVVGLLSEQRLQVRLVGRGEVTLSRGQVTARNRAQARYAIERVATETALSPCAVLRTTVGSRAWGLSDEDSDHDTRGVFLWPFPWACSRRSLPDVVVSADGSHTQWEFGRTLDQALRADPNTLEMLFVDDWTAIDPLGNALREHRAAFVSQAIYGSFGRYALAQSRKLNKSLRLAHHREVILDWLVTDPELKLDAAARRLSAEVLDDDSSEGTQQAKEYLKQLYGSMHDQGLLAGSSFEALAEFARTKPSDLALPRDLRPKNAYNLLRVIRCAIAWLRDGEPVIRTSGELRDRLLAIKRGSVDLKTALSWTDAASDELEIARHASVLPKKPDFAAADRLLLRAREQAAQRWLAKEPGPWGADAPAVPLEGESSTRPRKKDP